MGGESHINWYQLLKDAYDRSCLHRRWDDLAAPSRMGHSVEHVATASRTQKSVNGRTLCTTSDYRLTSRAKTSGLTPYLSKSPLKKSCWEPSPVRPTKPVFCIMIFSKEDAMKYSPIACPTAYFNTGCRGGTITSDAERATKRKR